MCNISQLSSTFIYYDCSQNISSTWDRLRPNFKCVTAISRQLKNVHFYRWTARQNHNAIDWKISGNGWALIPFKLHVSGRCMVRLKTFCFDSKNHINSCRQCFRRPEEFSKRFFYHHVPSAHAPANVRLIPPKRTVQYSYTWRLAH